MFEETRTAFTTLGFSDDEQNDVFKTLAAVLHLGNVSFVERPENDQESCWISVSCFKLHVIRFLANHIVWFECLNPTAGWGI